MKHKLLPCFIFLQFVAQIISAQVREDDIIGVWQTAGKEPAKIQVFKSGGKYWGKILSLQNPVDSKGQPRVDKNNPDKNKQTRPVAGLLILTNFRFDDDEWDNGDIYDPESGKTYSCTLTLKNKNTLKVRGYVGISLFGRTEVWTRTDP